MKGTNAARRRSWAFLVVGALLLAVGTVLVVVGSCERAGESDEGSERSRGATVALECPGWSSDNVPLGVFVEGMAADGSRRFEHLLFEGSGSRAIDLSNGECAAVPQLPQIMLRDGRVLSAGEPARARCADDAEAQLRVAYEAVDPREATDEELAEVAAASFRDGDAEARALESAKTLRDQAMEKEDHHA